jgi:hypothetical protein
LAFCCCACDATEGGWALARNPKKTKPSAMRGPTALPLSLTRAARAVRSGYRTGFALTEERLDPTTKS